MSFVTHTNGPEYLGRFTGRRSPCSCSTSNVVKLGSVNASIHKIDEHVRVADVADLCRMYERTLELLLLRPPEA